MTLQEIPDHQQQSAIPWLNKVVILKSEFKTAPLQNYVSYFLDPSLNPSKYFYQKPRFERKQLASNASSLLHITISTYQVGKNKIETVNPT